MNILLFRHPRFSLVKNTLYFFRKHCVAILLLGLTAALGRVAQLQGFGPVSGMQNILLEVIVETARIVLLLYVLGMANTRKGMQRIKNIVRSRGNFRNVCSVAFRKLKSNWFTVLLNTAGFLAIAWGINYMIDLTAYETCFYINLKENGILADASSQWTILLFFKNLTVIPLTLIFDALLVLWLINKLPANRQVALA
jgi:hypothetical protein